MYRKYLKKIFEILKNQGFKKKVEGSKDEIESNPHFTFEKSFYDEVDTRTDQEKIFREPCSVFFSTVAALGEGKIVNVKSTLEVQDALNVSVESSEPAPLPRNFKMQSISHLVQNLVMFRNMLREKNNT